MRLIDADELIKDIMSYKTMPEIRKAICEVIDDAPTVELPNYGGQVVPDTLQGWRYEERPHGEWLTPWEHEGRKYHTCSFCHITQRADTESRFCGYCGARMQGGTL